MPALRGHDENRPRKFRVTNQGIRQTTIILHSTKVRHLQRPQKPLGAPATPCTKVGRYAICCGNKEKLI